MFRKLALNGLVAAAIAATPIAAPQARAADPHDIIGGALALGVIGAIIVNENRKREERQRTTTYRYPQPKVEHQHDHRHNGYTHKHVHRGDHSRLNSYRPDRKPPQRVGKKARYPRECLRQKWTQKGWTPFYSASCLRKHGY